MRLGLVLNPSREPVCAFARRLAASAGDHGIDVVAYRGGETLGLAPWGGGADVDIVVAVGGDGTVLAAARLALAAARPVLGFNLGTIGFLAEAEPGELDETMAALAARSFGIADRLTLTATLPGGATATGVNDVVVEKIESQRLVALDVEIDGEAFVSYRCDGIVVATSTGSTAYAFSAGGPLVDPALDAILVTPVAAHSLFDRTLVLPPTARVVCRVGRDRPVRVSVDGLEIGNLGEGDPVAISAGASRVRFVVFDGEGFPARVTRKFRLRGEDR